jgi:CDP-4-dehydro-6-deoxyglucose reductase, E3
MFTIKLKNGKSFQCADNSTIFEAARGEGVFLEHSCLSARCRSCIMQLTEGITKDKKDDLVLSSEEKASNLVLSCNAIPITDIELDIEDLGGLEIFEKRISPAKINAINYLTDEVIEIIMRLPPSAKFDYHPGQYVNISYGEIKRSYSIANYTKKSGNLHFYIKNYPKGAMSQYWFDKAQVNDLLRIEGPLGSFFLRENKKENIVFLATGTGIAPVKAMLEKMNESPQKYVDNKIWIFWGARLPDYFFWNPEGLQLNLNIVKVCSQADISFTGSRGYIQDVLASNNIRLNNAQVYACGSNEMIIDAKRKLLSLGLSEEDFYSDAFVISN